MSRKILFGVALVILLACGLVAAVTQGLWKSFTDSDRVNTLAQRIADFDLLLGYQADYAVEILDYTIVAYKSADGNGHLVFLQAPPGVIPNEQALVGYVANNTPTMTWHNATTVYTTQRTIRSHPAIITVSDRTNGMGVRYRSLNTVFEGREGNVLVSINQPVTQWNETAVENFIASIH